MKTLIKSAIACGFAAASAWSTAAVTIAITPVSQTIDPGAQATYNVVVSDLSPTQLGAFAIQINFDPSIATGTSANFGSGFGNNPLNQFIDLSVPGQVYLADTADLGVDLSGQGSGFVLGSFTLTGVARGTTSLAIDSLSSLANTAADTVTFSAQDATLTVTPDLGSSASLLTLGLVGLGAMRKRSAKMN